MYLTMTRLLSGSFMIPPSGPSFNKIRSPQRNILVTLQPFARFEERSEVSRTAAKVRNSQTPRLQTVRSRRSRGNARSGTRISKYRATSPNRALISKLGLATLEKICYSVIFPILLTLTLTPNT